MSKPQLHWLITAFEPFAGRPSNNSQTVVEEIKKLADERAKDPSWNFKFYFATLPVEYDRCFDVLKAEVERLQNPGLRLYGILSIGEGAEEFKIETQGNNCDDVAEIADNAGVKRAGQKIFSELPIDATLPLRFPFAAFPRIRSSKNPGYYICNHLCTRMAKVWGSDPKAPFAGFIHVPKTNQGGVFTPDVCAAMIVNSFKNIE